MTDFSTLEPLLQKITSLNPRRAPLAIFDCDGTVIQGDIGEAMLYYQLEHFHFKASPAAAWPDHPENKELDRLYKELAPMDPGRRKSDPGFHRFADIVIGWYYSQLKEMKIGKACADIVSLFAGHSLAAVREIAAQTFADELRSPLTTRTLGSHEISKGIRFIKEAIQLLDDFRSRGFEIWAVSGSNKWSVEPVFKVLNVPSDRVIGIELVQRDGLLTTEPVYPVPVLEGKVEAAEKQIGDMPHVVLSDSPIDVPLFAFASHLRILVNSRFDSSEEFFRQSQIQRGSSWFVIEQPTLIEAELRTWEDALSYLTDKKTNRMADTQVTIIGGGAVGLAIAADLSSDHAPVFVLERNAKYGQETSSRNSEVIHAGLYYGKDTLKTRLCIEGNPQLYDLCEKHSIPHKKLTKVITATIPEEVPELEQLYKRGTENGVTLRMLTADEVTDLEPRIATHGGIHSPNSGIVSAHGLMDYYHHTAVERGSVIQPNCEVVGIQKNGSEYEISIRENGQVSSFTSEWVINSAGLESDKIAALAGIDVDEAKYQLHFCKGSYFTLPGKYRNVITRLVYPMPTKHSLGVHALVDLSGSLKFGPDVEYLSDRKQDYTVDESKRHAFAESVRRILPFIKDEDISPDMSGIRPKLQAKGEPMRDFVIKHEADRGLPGLINLIGIESPGLTASPAIAKYVRGLMKS